MKSKKELKEAYKQMYFRMGVYQIRNTRNGKVLISSSMDLDRAWHSPRLQLRGGTYPNTQLQNDWLQQGEADFVFEIVEELKDTTDPSVNYKQEIKILEKMVMQDLQPYGDKGYHKN